MNALLYYGVTLNTTHMAGNTFINYFLLSIIELPGGWLAGKLVETTGLSVNKLLLSWLSFK